MHRLASTSLLALLALTTGWAACTSSDEPPAEKEARARPFAITDECGGCVEDALDGACSAQADACEADADCSAIAECVIECDPSDAACAQDCVAQSPNGAQLFEDLAGCVVCDTCPSECDGAWDCGGGSGGGGVGGGSGVGGGGVGGGGVGGGSGVGGGGVGGGSGTCDGTGDCDICALCAAIGACEAEAAACFGGDDAACDQAEACVLAECPVDCDC